MDQALLFPMHDAYQNTGVIWLSDIPAHWEFKKNKYLFTEKKLTVGKQSSDYTLLSLTLRGVIARDMDNPQGKFPAEFNAYKIVNPNDLIFCLFDIEETPRTIGLAQQHGMITGAYTVMECQPEVSARYLSYYYLYLDTDKKLKPLYTGLRKVIQRDTFMSIRSPLPPRDEQERIANFLDQKTTEIEETIAKKQRLVELLKEQKAILINQTVTKGLNSNVSMRESGVEWIGEVPEHWNGKKAKFLFTQSRLPVQKEDDVVTAYRDGQVTLRSNRRTEGYTIAILEQGYQGIRKGQLVLNSMDAFAGAIGVSDSDGKCSPEYVICDPIDRKEVVPMYYALLLREMALSGYIEVISSAVRQRAMRIRFSNLSSLLLPVPPLKEQIEIEERVSALKGKFDAVMDILDHEIEAIKEYRTILIANAVTGKIKL